MDCNEQKLQRFVEHLENTFKPNENDDSIEWKDSERKALEIKQTSPKDIAKNIKDKIYPQKVPALDLITREILKQLTC